MARETRIYLSGEMVEPLLGFVNRTNAIKMDEILKRQRSWNQSSLSRNSQTYLINPIWHCDWLPMLFRPDLPSDIFEGRIEQ